MKPLHLVLAAACLLAPTAGWCASFDCAKAAAPDEKAICADRTLNDLDVRMAALFEISQHFLGMGARGALQDDQRAWLDQRRHCGADGACLAAAYKKRIGDFQGVLDRAYTLGPL